MTDQRTKNKEVFRDTERMCTTNAVLKEMIRKSNERQYVLLEEEELTGSDEHRYEAPAHIVVSKKRSLEAAAAYKGQRTLVHNFASATNPGGGVTKGSNAQEEAICRCSTLYFSISVGEVMQLFHSRHRQMLWGNQMNAAYNDDCIYTPDVCVFKSDTDTPELLPEAKWYPVDVVTCAAPNLREKPSNAMNPGSGDKQIQLTDQELLELHVKRVSRILDLAKKEKVEVVILGAFGCGAFSNPPQIVAEAMARVIQAYLYDFRTIEFAVYCSPKNTENYDVFSRRLKQVK